MSVSAAPPQEVGSKSVATETHLGYLDGVRAIAATFVAFHHALLQIDPKSTPLTSAVYQIFSGTHAHFAVDVFIVISGFCLMLPVVRGDGTLRGGAMHFFKKRARRILPPYFITMGMCLVLIWLFIGKKTGTHWDDSLPITTKGIITHVLLIHDAFKDSFTQINNVFWSISVEWRIYFLFPLLVVSWRKIGPITTTALTVIGSYVLLSLFYRTPINTQTCGVTPQYIGLFAVGMLGAGIARTKRNWLNHLLGWKPLAFLGTFAYSIYLIHAPPLQLFTQYVFEPLHLTPNTLFLSLYFVAMPLVLCLCYVFYLFCERPFLNRKPNAANSTVGDRSRGPSEVRNPG